MKNPLKQLAAILLVAGGCLAASGCHLCPDCLRPPTPYPLDGCASGGSCSVGSRGN
ncbi:hypothetical protein KOR34_46450 [Posidoniimonas corsicana]|uniref:Lipoprotein n=1 Tax=Posidoniimonas corsicana TaxID=1938618 RepID=A0A5C5UZJ6_9BACT|nr:hypothetical protein KOR34_46450 [Posidoniimonas corsicana]